MSRRPYATSPARRAVTRMMGFTIAVHTLAITVYRLADVERRTPDVRRVFFGVWLGATLVVVGLGLYGVRQARDAARAARLARRDAAP